MKTWLRIQARWHVGVTLALGWSAAGLQAQSPSVPGTLAAEIDRLVAPYVARLDFMGVVGFQRAGTDATVLPYGMANVELRVPHTSESIFLIGSLSKQFTAAAVLLLEEDGLLSTADPVARHLPDFPHGRRITLEQLLTHTAGVADIFSLELFGNTEGLAGQFWDVVAALGEAELNHDPGATFLYTNGGYALLAAIIETVSGRSYGEFLEERLFEPLGMDDTGHDSPREAIRYRVSGYDPWGPESLAPAPRWSEAFTTGSGSLWSSARDLLSWSSALHQGRVLATASYSKLTRDYGYGYGLGLSVFQRFGRDVFGHDGRVAGFSSDLAFYVQDSLSVVILSNVQSVARDEVRRAVGAAVLDEVVPEVAGRALAPSSPALQELTGTYSFGPGFQVAIFEADGRLMARANQGGASELVPLEGGDWFSRMLYTTVRFEVASSGRAGRLIWGAGDQAPVGSRIN